MCLMPRVVENRSNRMLFVLLSFAFLSFSLSCPSFVSSCQERPSYCNEWPISNNDIVWEHTLSETYVAAISQCLDGSYLVAGSIVHNDIWYPWLGKLNNGVVETSVYIDKPSTSFMGVHSLGDGTFIAASSKHLYRFNDDLSDIWIVPSDGDQVGNFNVRAIDLNDEGFAFIHEDVEVGSILMRYDINGNKMWQDTFEEIRYILLLDDGGLAILNYDEMSSPSNKQTIERLDINGDTLWKKTITIDDCNSCYFVYATSLMGNEISIIWNDGQIGGNNQLIGRVGEEGDLIWLTKVPFERTASALSEAQDGSIILVGNTCNMRKERFTDVWLSSLDRNGNKLWDRYFGNEEGEYSNTIHTSRSGCIVVSAAVSEKQEGHQNIYYWIFGFTDTGSGCTF